MPQNLRLRAFDFIYLSTPMCTTGKKPVTRTFIKLNWVASTNFFSYHGKNLGRVKLSSHHQRGRVLFKLALRGFLNKDGKMLIMEKQTN